MVGRLGEDVGHHGLPTVKNFKTTLPKSCLSINFRFSGRVSKPTKTSNKDYPFYNTVSLKKHQSFYKPQLTQHYRKYTPATQPKTLLTLQIFQQICCWLVSDKTFALHHF